MDNAIIAALLGALTQAAHAPSPMGQSAAGLTVNPDSGLSNLTQALANAQAAAANLTNRNERQQWQVLLAFMQFLLQP